MGELLLNSSLFLASSGAAEAGHAEHAGGSHHSSFAGNLIYISITLLVMFVLLIYARKGMNQKVFKNPLTSMLEQLYLFIENMCVSIIGVGGRKYIPMIMTIWIVIFLSNFISLFFPTAPTADLSFNLGIALLAVGYVQYEGIRANGFFGHLSHFAGPKLGFWLIPISIMLFVIEIVSEMMKNVSLSLRLYGNIHGGHQAVTAMNELGEPFFVPFGAFLLPIKLLTCVVQALIFTLLTCVYISLVTHHDEEHGHEEEHGSTPAMAH